MRIRINQFKFNIKYAIGEIILVVIGILIAVSINNWNEERRQQKELHTIITSVKEDLENDIEEIKTIEKHYTLSDSIFTNVINGKITRKHYEENHLLAYLILGYPEISYNTRGLSLLKNFSANTDVTNNKIINEIIGFYTERMVEIKVDEDLRAKDFTDNFEYWKNNKTWWADYIIQKDISSFIDYALNDQDYKNRVATFHFLTYKAYLPEIKKFKDKGTALIQAIDKELAK